MVVYLALCLFLIEAFLVADVDSAVIVDLLLFLFASLFFLPVDADAFNTFFGVFEVVVRWGFLIRVDLGVDFAVVFCFGLLVELSRG